VVLVPLALAPPVPKPQAPPSWLLPLPLPEQQPLPSPPVQAWPPAWSSRPSAVPPLSEASLQPPPVLPRLGGPRPAQLKPLLPPVAWPQPDPPAAATQWLVSAAKPRPQDEAEPQRYSEPAVAAEQSFSAQVLLLQAHAGSLPPHLPPAQLEPRSPPASPQPAPPK
jgi:hypothetical protein